MQTYSPWSSRTMSSSVSVEEVRVVRGVLGVISVDPLYHTNEGDRELDVSHRNVTDWPIDTEMMSGVTVGMAERK